MKKRIIIPIAALTLFTALICTTCFSKSILNENVSALSEIKGGPYGCFKIIQEAPTQSQEHNMLFLMRKCSDCTLYNVIVCIDGSTCSY